MPENTQEPSNEEISKRAWEIWDQEGRPEGRSEEHWNRAREEIGSGGAGPAELAEEKRTPDGENI